MSGVAGFVSLDGPRRAEWLQLIGRRFVFALHHRGPDDNGIYVSPDRRVLLVATRLAVRDLSTTGHQPMISPDGTVVLAYDGEVYGNRTPVDRWPRRGHCDTEQFLQVVHNGPPAAVAGLDGMFAAAWYDRRTGQTVLARDHFGIRPLVWTRVAGGILFASDVAALLATGLVPADVDWAGFLHRAYVRTDATDEHTWLSGVHAVEPAHLLVIDDGRVSHQRYWTPEGTQRPVAAEEIAEAFRRAVAIRRPADVPMATVVSGDVYSSAVVGAVRCLGLDAHPYVVRYEGADASQNEDLPYALDVARTTGVQPAYCDIGVDDLEVLTATATHHLQRPLLHGAELALLRTYENIAGDGRVVAFSGHGSAELWGHPELAHLPADLSRLPDDAEQHRWLRRHRNEQATWHRIVGELCQYFGVSDVDITDRLWETTLRPQNEPDTLHPDQRGRYHTLRRFLAQVNEVVDACSSAHSVEDRPVFQDVTLAGLALAMPEWRRAQDRPDKSNPHLRRALAPYLAPSVLNRAKRGYPAPRGPAFQAHLRNLVDEAGLPGGARLSRELLAAAGTGELLFLYSSRIWLEQLSRTAGPTVRSDTHGMAAPNAGVRERPGVRAAVAGP